MRFPTGDGKAPPPNRDEEGTTTLRKRRKAPTQKRRERSITHMERRGNTSRWLVLLSSLLLWGGGKRKGRRRERSCFPIQWEWCLPSLPPLGWWCLPLRCLSLPVLFFSVCLFLCCCVCVLFVVGSFFFLFFCLFECVCVILGGRGEEGSRRTHTHKTQKQLSFLPEPHQTNSKQIT